MKIRVIPVLKSKTKSELITEAKRAGLRGYSKKNHKELVSYLLFNLSERNFEVLLDISKPQFYRTWWFALILSILVAFSFYWLDKRDSDVQLNEQNQVYQDNKIFLLKEKEYMKKINEAEILNLSLLQSVFEEYIVYGIIDGKVAIPEKRGEIFRFSKGKSEILFDSIKGVMRISLNLDEFFINNSIVVNSRFYKVVKIPKLGELIGIGPGINGKGLYIVMLNQDLINPIVVLGIK